MSPGYRLTVPHVTTRRDLWVRLDIGDGRRGPACSIGNTHHMAGLEGAARAYQYADCCRFLEHESTPLSCRTTFLETIEVHTCRKNPRKSQKVSTWEPAAFRSVRNAGNAALTPSGFCDSPNH